MSKNESRETGAKVLDEIFNKLDLKPLIDSAIVQALTDEAKEQLIKGIMSYLSKSTGSYSSQTHLQEAFNISIQSVVREQVTKVVESDPRIIAEVQKCINSAVEKFISMDKQGLTNNLVNSLTNAFTIKDRYSD